MRARPSARALAAIALLASRGGIADEGGGADDEEAGEEEGGAEWLITISVHRGLDCQDEFPFTYEVSDEESGLPSSVAPPEEGGGGGRGGCSAFDNPSTGNKENLSPFELARTEARLPWPDMGYVRTSCGGGPDAKTTSYQLDGEEGTRDADPLELAWDEQGGEDGNGAYEKVITLDFFKKPDCTQRMCLHTVDLDHDLCDAPSCKLDPEPGQTVRDQDPECQCGDLPGCGVGTGPTTSCGMCSPRFPQGFENGKCVNICMDGSAWSGGVTPAEGEEGHTGLGWVSGSSNFPSTDSHLTDLHISQRLCNDEALASVVVEWEGGRASPPPSALAALACAVLTAARLLRAACFNSLRKTGLIVLAVLITPVVLVGLRLMVGFVKSKEWLCWKPNGRCFGQRCGRIVVTVEDANAGLSKYEIKMKERKRDQEMQDKWAAHRRAEKKEEKRHEKMRATAVDAKNKAGAAVSPATEKKGPGRTTKVKISDGKEEEEKKKKMEAEKKKQEEEGQEGKAARRKEGGARQKAKEAKKEENRLRAEQRRKEAAGEKEKRPGKSRESSSRQSSSTSRKSGGHSKGRKPRGP